MLATLCLLAAVRPTVVQRARCAGPVMQQRDDPSRDVMMRLVGSMICGIETAVEAAKISTNNYINSGWQARCPPRSAGGHVASRVPPRPRLLSATAPPSRLAARHPRRRSRHS
jgi:hypothetical protein